MENIQNRIGIRVRSSELVWESESEFENHLIKIINRVGNSELKSESELEAPNLELKSEPENIWIRIRIRVRNS